MVWYWPRKVTLVPAGRSLSNSAMMLFISLATEPKSRPWVVAKILIIGWILYCDATGKVLLRLTARQRLEPAQGRGVWNELDRLLFRGQAEMRTRKRRLLDMLRAYRAAAAALPDGVVVVERNSQRVQWFNKAASSLLGLQYPADIGAPVGDRLQPLPMSHWLAAGRNAEPMLDAASPVDPDLRLNLRLIPYSDQYWLLVARDVSKMLRLEQMRRDFVANVSHELRTPLTVLSGYLETLLEQSDDTAPRWQKAFRRMDEQTQRMKNLVNDLLTLSRLENQGDEAAAPDTGAGSRQDTGQDTRPLSRHQTAARPCHARHSLLALPACHPPIATGRHPNHERHAGPFRRPAGLPARGSGQQARRQHLDHVAPMACRACRA